MPGRASGVRRALLLATAALVAAGSASAQQDAAPLQDFNVRLVAPQGDDVVSGRVELRAEVAADRVDEVLFVEFEVDGRVLFADATAPYELIWNPREPAAHVIVVRAFGPAGTVVEHVVRTAAPPAVPAAGAFRSRADQVEVYVHVDADRRQFAAADFALFENGVEQSLLAVDHSSELPVALGFMLDSSGSMLRNLGYAIDTAGSAELLWVARRALVRATRYR